jgi:hypothetical protein
MALEDVVTKVAGFEIDLVLLLLSSTMGNI